LLHEREYPFVYFIVFLIILQCCDGISSSFTDPVLCVSFIL
jgi:hypothetical protein